MNLHELLEITPQSEEQQRIERDMKRREWLKELIWKTIVITFIIVVGMAYIRLNQTYDIDGSQARRAQYKVEQVIKGRKFVETFLSADVRTIDLYHTLHDYVALGMVTTLVEDGYVYVKYDNKWFMASDHKINEQIINQRGAVLDHQIEYVTVHQKIINLHFALNDRPKNQ